MRLKATQAAISSRSAARHAETCSTCSGTVWSAARILFHLRHPRAKPPRLLRQDFRRRLTEKMEEAIWVQESFKAAREHVYVPPIGMGRGPFTITPKYLEEARAVGRNRVGRARGAPAN